MKLQRSPSEAVVIGVMAIALLVFIWVITPRAAHVPLSLILAYEAWTLINGFANDTLSEAIWQLAARPIVPFLFGCAFGWSMTAGVLVNPWVIAGTAFLMGHFFFQAQKESKQLIVNKTMDAAVNAGLVNREPK